ncbi:hypothetical protein [Actinoplanes sp. TFC3]|uniref:hypothetical protein n=1 Tax=Actinoplanes sp. TFC3 TaxID=1710355 RepID=UPI000829E0D1|nr:hypothetical protein [Actinoplanes sp. TFC3]
MADGLQIRTELVSELAQGLRADADDGFRTAAAQGAALHGQGIVFGTSMAGETVLEAKHRYAQVLEHVEANLREYQRLAARYADAAHRLAHALQAVDGEVEAGLQRGQQ